MIGLVIVVCGMAGSMVCGLILDRTHAYKATTLSVYFFSFVGMILYTFTFRFGSIAVVYFTSACLGSVQEPDSGDSGVLIHVLQFLYDGLLTSWL